MANTPFRLLLAVLLIALAAYTISVIASDGIDFVRPFFGAIAAGGWQGQFNSDFAILLLLIGLWAAWRNRFSGLGIVLGLLGMLLGAAFLTAYLLYLSWRERGDVVRMLVGDRARKN